MIREALLQRYSGDSANRVASREAIEAICRQHIDLGYADPTFENNVCSENDFRHAQGLSEALVSHELRSAGLTVQPSRDGPDLLVLNGARRIWVEVICPTPNGIPADWLEPALDGDVRVVNFPHPEILLRWTAAIKEKAEKLLGNPTLNVQGYIERGIVRPDDSYVIVVNGCLLRGSHTGIKGISQLPFAVEATLRLGPYAIRINARTLEQVGEGHTWRASVPNANGAPVPTDTFFDPRFAPISAVLAVDLDAYSPMRRAKPMALVHNPHAIAPVDRNFLPAEEEYVVTFQNETEFQLDRKPGRLAT